jgi:hypothetical protein
MNPENNKGIKVTLWLPKTRCKELLCAPTLTQAALNRPQTKGLTYISRVSDFNVINMIFKSFRIKKMGDPSKASPFE